MLKNSKRKIETCQLPPIKTVLTADEVLRNRLDFSKVKGADDEQLIMKWNDSKGLLFYLLLKRAIDDKKEIMKQQKLLELRNKKEIKKRSITYESWLLILIKFLNSYLVLIIIYLCSFRVQKKDQEIVQTKLKQLELVREENALKLNQVKEKRVANYISYSKWLDNKNNNRNNKQRLISISKSSLS